MNKKALDKYLTTEPDNGFIDWLEKVYDLIPEEKISSQQYEENEEFLSYWENKLSLAGKNGFPSVKFSADVLIRRFKQFSLLKERNWIMITGDSFEKHDVYYSLSEAYDYESRKIVK